ncbi:O-acetyl-ADP-ribose deacetylase [Leptospira koniambonensis]|uniref:O-acetyl-ADP-ribose deacetylase n=1 Tax=Leptospira koniambonensis TaxID=2484950 RepID=A0A4R9J5S5_9LEPT|nr:O-acetyl-ADP-ribose deacetylase [Leptospira koniambonensis]TGL31648.1 O-acetyl-ADP-ribose deacetylase [Leptospira koniambonensis]
MNKNSNIEIIKGDITKLSVDAVVNAANSSLLGGGGVDGAIHKAGGPLILAECRKIIARQGGCKVGEAVITSGGNLPAKFVIHTVGPVWNGGSNNEEIMLSNCYTNSLSIALESGCKSIAFPGISTGIYRFPKELASSIAINTVKNHSGNLSFERIIFVCFDTESEYYYKSKISL